MDAVQRDCSVCMLLGLPCNRRQAASKPSGCPLADRLGCRPETCKTSCKLVILMQYLELGSFPHVPGQLDNHPMVVLNSCQRRAPPALFSFAADYQF